jgi:ectoine hydroxylase-related dioxygenase (phytanoyl-CoA dioxygenase family)
MSEKTTKDMTKPMTKPMTKDMVKPMTKDMVKPMTKDMVKPMTKDIVKSMIKPMAKDMVNPMIKPKIKDTNIFSFDANEKDFKKWAAFFHTNGYIVINNALSQNVIHDLRTDLERLNKGSDKQFHHKNDRTKLRDDNSDNDKKATTRHTVHKCFFEKSKTTCDLVENSVLVDFAQYLIGDVPGGRGNSLTAHLIHNNAFTVPPNGRGQAPSWHTDDPLQQIIIPEGKTLPDYIKLPVLVVTYMIWLSDCETIENGPTRVVPGSHRWGKLVDKDKAEQLGIPTCGKAGTAVLVNSQTWHRGSENTSTVPRHTLQLSFARRIIGHKFKTIMNYTMPNYVTHNRNAKTLERFGFLQGGAYS